MVCSKRRREADSRKHGLVRMMLVLSKFPIENAINAGWSGTHPSSKLCGRQGQEDYKFETSLATE